VACCSLTRALSRGRRGTVTRETARLNRRSRPGCAPRRWRAR